MSLKYFKCADFRCLENVEFEPDPHYNLIYGANASGKTSLLEAIGYLGRGRSFRAAGTDKLVRHGASEFVLFGRTGGRRETSIGVRNGRRGLEISIDGDKSGGAASLAEALPLQVMDPEVHNLVAGGPEERRRYLDWIVFHVEPGYLDTWRRFRRALKQRNAGLREGAGDAALRGFGRELAETGLAVHDARRRTLEVAGPALEQTGAELLGCPVSFEYVPGWNDDRTLAQALDDGVERDRQLGSTQSGPQRADLRLGYDDRQARKLVSRGQQKLLASTLILAATEIVQTEREQPLTLLLDDPAAELDEHALARLMDCVGSLGCQVIATALEPDAGILPQPPALFHVERGQLDRVE